MKVYPRSRYYPKYFNFHKKGKKNLNKFGGERGGEGGDEAPSLILNVGITINHAELILHSPMKYSFCV